MAKHRYELDEKKIARFKKEGRGTGRGKDYKPWLKIQDVSSLGRSTRVFCFKTGREHHCLSDLETGLFFLLDWSEAVTDLREQFPLDRAVTRALAKQMGIKHPRDNRTETDIVMTTDFLVDLRAGSRVRRVALSVKIAAELDKARVIEKQELERRYWQRENVEWYLVTDRDLPKQRIDSLRWLHEMRSLEHFEQPHPDYWNDRCSQFLAQFQRVRGGLIREFLSHLENTCQFKPGEGLTVLRHLAANRLLGLDLDRPFSTGDSISRLTVLAKPQSERRQA